MIKLPRTLHIEGSRMPAYWKTPDPEAVEFAKLAGEFLVVEEKVDGTGVSLFFDDKANLTIWHRGSPAIGEEFAPLKSWAHLHENDLFDLLGDRYILFGEWMLNKHSIFYDRLPNFFLESDIYDKLGTMWLSTPARNAVLNGHQNYIKSVPILASLKPDKLSQLTSLITRSQYQSENWRVKLWDRCEKMVLDLAPVLKETDQSDLAEGLYIKQEDDRHVIGRYKYVRYEFVENIVNSGTHVRDRVPVMNYTLGGY